MHHQNVGHRHQKNDRRKALERIVGQALGEMWIHRETGMIAHQDHGAVGRSLGHRVVGEHAVSGGAILDHHDRRASRLAHLGGEYAGQNVADAGGRGRHDEFYGLRRIVIAMRRQGRGQQHCRDAGESISAVHDGPLRSGIRNVA